MDRNCGGLHSTGAQGFRPQVPAWLVCAACCAALVGLRSAAQAQAPASEMLDPLVVSATGIFTPAFEVPASVSSVSGDDARQARLAVNLAESAGAVPGLVARDRQNYAQDEQVQIRGFGARASFGLRGLAVLVDGIPSTLPDGQGWVSNIDLASVDRIEVLRGPYSALYGNSAGGVIETFTRRGSGAPQVTPGFAAGSYGQVRESTSASGSTGAVDYDLDLVHFQTDGYRAHSAAMRDFGNVRLDFGPDEDSHLMLVLNSVASPTAQDPMGLTRAEFNANARGVDPAAVEFDTRKSFDQTQVGAAYERRIDAQDELSVRAYGGDRNATQYQAIPVAAQTPASPGGVIVLGRSYDGVDTRWTRQWNFAGGPMSLTAGIVYGSLDEARTGFLDYAGAPAAPTLGVAGQLRNNQANKVRDLDEYLQALWQFLPAWNATAGLRHSRLDFGSRAMPTAVSASTVSSSAEYGADLPVLGVEYAASEWLRLYGNAARGFETPTLNELAYRPDGSPGLNFALRPDHSVNFELGAKSRGTRLGEWNAALFLIDTQQEIVTQTNAGGHAAFQNAGATRRDGFELAWARELAGAWRARLAYTYLDAYFRDAYLTCLTTPCLTPNRLVSAGSRIPAIVKSSLDAALERRPPAGWQGGIELRADSSMAVDDINSQSAPGYATLGLYAGYRWRVARWDVSAFGRVDNSLGRTYAGSVIVDETSGRFFETAPGRNFLGGISGTYRFD